VVDANGIIVFRYVGPITSDAALATLRKALAQAGADKS